MSTQNHKGQALTAKETTLQLQWSFVNGRFFNPKINQNGTYPISLLEIKVPSVSEIPVDFQKTSSVHNSDMKLRSPSQTFRLTQDTEQL